MPGVAVPITPPNPFWGQIVKLSLPPIAISSIICLSPGIVQSFRHVRDCPCRLSSRHFDADFWSHALSHEAMTQIHPAVQREYMTHEQDDREVLIKVGSITTLPCPFSTLPSSSRNEPDPDDDTLCDRVSECCSSHRDPPVASYPYDEYEWDNCEVLIKAGSITTLSWPFSTLSSSRYEPDPDDSTAGICCGIERQQGRAEEVGGRCLRRRNDTRAPVAPRLCCPGSWMWRIVPYNETHTSRRKPHILVYTHVGGSTFNVCLTLNIEALYATTHAHFGWVLDLVVSVGILGGAEDFSTGRGCYVGDDLVSMFWANVH
ncbi:hypothetical protein JB92DRAFT_3271573 [Gautieria morchelliformis]|nr:hypothetical protein JB92DRAFT_3271573 [Gautieria morchelliformis]